ncbi:MAG: UDP-N-acetylglucosamine 1-carboxyvinyltransferase, partial [Candidatus Doudnabacteria bacterium Gr01-1014_77]
ATQAQGTTQLHEWMYEGRLGYIHELSKMGAKAHIIDQHRAEITGPTELSGTDVSSLDVRSGMVLVISALVAKGQSTLHEIQHIERGYEDIVNKLKAIGADIERVE